jgi:hypothetical protein
MSFSLNCPQIGCYNNFECDVQEPGRIVAIALVDKNHSDELDTTGDDQDFLDSLFTLALEGNAQLLLNISGEKPRPETAEGPGRGLRQTTILASTQTINFVDMQGVPNTRFYNIIRRSSQNYDMWFFTKTLIWDASAQDITLLASNVITNDLQQYIGAEGTIKWTSNDDPVPDSFSLTKTLLNGLAYEISGAQSVATTVAVGGSENYTATLNYDFASGSLPDLIWSLENTAAEIAVLDAQIDEVTGILTYDPTEAGVFVLTVKVTNEFGCIFGTYDVTFTITT